MIRFFWILIGLVVLVIPEHDIWAGHPTEGVLSLDALIGEALEQSPEIKSAEANLRSASAQYQATSGAFSPQLSLEGGPLATQFDAEKNSGVATYGKVEWNLYEGGKSVAERSIGSIEKRLAQNELAQVRARVTREVARAYYEMAFILESIAIQEKALAINQEQMKLARAKKSAGFTSEADVIEFELREAMIKSDLKDLRQEQESKSRELSVLLGRGEASGGLTVKGHLQRSKDRPRKDKVIQRILELNPDVIEARASLDISREKKNAARSGFLPKVDLEAKYGKISTEETVFSARDNYSIGVTLNIPLFSGFSDTNQWAAASAKVAQSESQLTKKTLVARGEAETLYSQLVTLQDRLDLEEKTLARSEQYYSITLGEYRRGVKNSPDMVAAAERVIHSRIRNLEFRRDYQIAILRLLALVGASSDDKSWFSVFEGGKVASLKKRLSPGEVHEECMSLNVDQALSYAFTASLPLNFNIHYHEGKSVFYPVKRDGSDQHDGLFEPSLKQDYCLMWANVNKVATIVHYEFRVK